MTGTGKAPLDTGRTPETPDRAARFAEIERREGAAPGAKEMAMTRRPRAEDQSTRLARFLDIDHRADG